MLVCLTDVAAFTVDGCCSMFDCFPVSYLDAEAPSMSVVPTMEGSDLMVFWTLLPPPDAYFVWYKCDDMEALIKLNGTDFTLTIPSVRELLDHCVYINIVLSNADMYA